MLTITPIPALESNYFWIIRPNQMNPHVYVVDPGDAEPIIDYLDHNQLKLSAILITHRHRDHTEGIDQLLECWPVPVFGPESELIPSVTQRLKDGDTVVLDDISLTVIAVPGHTWEHIAYFYKGAGLNPPALFCGDALFAGGCGRRFDGTAEIMWNSLQKLAALPDSTQVYCAHEYTLANLEFAIAVEPNNLDLNARYRQVKEVRAEGKVTLPSNILLEKQTNPFLRCQYDGIKIFIQEKLQDRFDTPAKVFGALRLIKDTWPN